MISRCAKICAALLMTAGVSVAGTEAVEKQVYTASSAFDVMKTLDGTWEGESLTVPVGKEKADGVKSSTTVMYKTIANDTSIIATYGEGSPMEMVSMFHQDGPETLIHTHYCAVGNQPSMAFEVTDEPGTIVFRFTSGTNMDVSKDGHVHHSTLRIIDEDTIETETELWNGGKKAATRYATLTRK